MSLIPADDSLAVWSVLLGGAAFAAWAERTRLGRQLSAVLVAILLAMVLSNLRVIPRASPTYDAAMGWLIPVSITLLLLDANLRRIIRETGRMLLAFGLGTLGTVVGVLVGLRLIPLGESAWQLAGVFSATYIGGGLNFVAVAQATGFQDGGQMAASVAADNLVTALYIMAVMALPAVAWLRRWIPSPLADRAARDTGQGRVEEAPAAEVPFNLLRITLALAVAFTIAAAGRALAQATGLADFSILFVSALALVPANLFPRLVPHVAGHAQLGMIGIYIFLFILGASADVWAMLGSALPITLFALVVVAVHMAVIVGLGGLLRFDLAELIIASNACVGGSSSAGPIAAARGWHELVTPGILCGALGNAIGTFIGVALARWVGG